MKRRSFLSLLSLTAMLPSSSCKCSADPTATGGNDAGSDAGSATPTLSEQSFTLSNGLQVDLAHGACGDMVGLAALVGVGVDHDPAGRSGMAHLLERLIASAAGKATVEGGDDYTLISTTANEEDIRKELSHIVSWMTRPPTEDDLARERKLVVGELSKLRGDDAAATAKSLAEDAIVPARNQGKRSGIAEQIDKITLEELGAFYKDHVKAGNTRISVVGPFDANAMRAHIETAFASVDKGKPPVAGPPATATVKGTLVMGDAPSAVAIAIPAPEVSKPAFGSFLVLAARLLNAEGQSWKVAYDPIRRPDVLFVTGSVTPGAQAEPAANQMRKEIAAIIAPPASAADVTGTSERFRLFLDPGTKDLSVCAADAKALAIARVRTAQWGGPPTKLELEAVDAHLEQARALFGAKRSAAVIAGGAIAEPPTNTSTDE